MAEYQDYGHNNAEASHIFDYIQQPLMQMLDKDKNRCILDLGCGNGYLVNQLLGLGFNIYGTDASEKGVAIAREKNPDRFFVQDLSTGKLPVELQGLKFDTVISTEVIEHLYNPQLFVEFCRDILTKDGELMISTPYHGYLKNLMLALFNKWDIHANPLWLGGHIKLWSAKTLSQLLTDGGFKVTDFKGCGRFPYFWKSMLIKAQLV
jgi:2-polyprenyl-3-methyl-5-hydroxy-6-metoxy-1,4-benzoquinol methylase